MYELPNNDPLLRSRRFDPDRPTGASLTIGSVAILADAVAETREMLRKLDELAATLPDLERRIASVEASTRAAIADADRRDALRRGGPRL